MIRTSPIVLSIIGASVLAIFSSASVQAKKAGDWTCEDFLKVPKSAQSKVVYWTVGLNRSEMKEAADVSAKDFNVPISRVVQHCHKQPADNLWDAIANHFYWNTMKIP